MSETPVSHGEQRPFEADVAKLLELVVHSIYSDRDIFLRELISNAADACEKLRFETIASSSDGETWTAEKFGVVIAIDKQARQISVSDNGIGMSRADLESALGVIANSGTRAFLESLSAAKDKPSPDALIGRFGIGFYSAFIVADHVEVFTRKAGQDESWVWSSDGKGTYAIAPAPEKLPHGARIVLHLKADADSYLEPHTIERIIGEHSVGVSVPISIVEEDGSLRALSDGAALWTRPKASISEEEYSELYRTVSSQFDTPALTIHWRAEGRHEFDAVAFIPSARPMDLFSPTRRGRSRLYVRRVLVSADADLLPPWLRFVTLIVDSADVPLNVSREIVQKSPVLGAIRKAVVGRILQELTKLAQSEPDKYAEIWKNFGSALKEGLYEDYERRDALYGLARFATTREPKGQRSLAQYIADLRPNQTAIYYLTGGEQADLAASPHLEGFRERGLETLLLSDPVDSFWVANAAGFEGKPFRSVTQGKLDLDLIPFLDGQEAPKAVEPTAASTAFLKRLKDVLSDVVADTRASDRLADSAACLVASENAPDLAMARILAGTRGMDMAPKPVLEVNLRHPLIEELAADNALGDDDFQEASRAVYDLARIADNEIPDNAADFSRRMARWMARALNRA